MNLIINLGKHASKYNYLLNSSKYFFELDDKLWSSVDQYMLSTYHNKNTDIILNGMICETDYNTMIKNLEGYCPEASSTNINVLKYEELLFKAMLAKFKQNPNIRESLMDLKQFKIMSDHPDLIYVALILEHIRDFLIKESQTIKTAKYVIPYPENDIPDHFKNLSILDTKIISEIYRVLKLVKDFYYEFHYQVEMLDTVFYNIFGRNKEIVVCLKRWFTKLTWNEITSKMQKFNANIDAVDSQLKKLGFNREYSLKFSIYIAIFIRWVNYNKRDSKKNILIILDRIKGINDIYAIPLEAEFKKRIPSQLIDGPDRRSVVMNVLKAENNFSTSL